MNIPQTMRAALIVGWSKPLVVDTIPVPDLGPGDVLIQIKAAGAQCILKGVL